ncbi:hypothetical protein F5Y08DRAFT_313380 [Xylaria arbuscula]|nr:hypothetical protein F5Y08DRAFT_313380 [Xylaria arbuscula]
MIYCVWLPRTPLDHLVCIALALWGTGPCRIWDGDWCFGHACRLYDCHLSICINTARRKLRGFDSIRFGIVARVRYRLQPRGKKRTVYIDT